MGNEVKEIKKQNWIRIIKECASSGIPKEQWLKEHNIPQASFYKWQKIIREEMAVQLLENNRQEPVFVEVPDEQTIQIPSVPHTAVIKAGTVSIEISEDITDIFLKRILKAMKNA